MESMHPGGGLFIEVNCHCLAPARGLGLALGHFFKGGHGVGVSVSIRVDIHVQVMVRVVCDPASGGIFIEINRLCLALEYFVEREHCVLVGIRFGHHHIVPVSPSPQLCFGIHQLSCLCWCLVNW